MSSRTGKGAWWGSDAEYLGAWQGLAATPACAGAVADRDRDAARVPASRRPGTAAPAAGNRPADRAAATRTPEPADERLLGKIRALLAKAESTEFAEEAEALSARAQELMAKYSIDHALLAAETGRTEKPGGRRIAVDNPYEAPKASLLQTVAQANRCRVVWSKELGLVTVIGFPADLDAVELLFTSLLVQANSAMLRAGAKRDCLRAVQDPGVPPVVPGLLRDPHRGAAVRGRPVTRSRGGRSRPRRSRPRRVPAARTWCRSSRHATGPSMTRSTRCSATP